MNTVTLLSYNIPGLGLLTIDNFDTAVLSINALIFIFSKRIVNALPSSRDETTYNTRLWALRVINLAVFLLLLASIVLPKADVEGEKGISELARQLSQTGLTLLMSFMITHLLQVFIVKRFGRTRDIEGVEYRTQTYQSEMYSLIVLILAIITVFLVILNIWKMTSLLQATSVFGGLLLIIYSTKDVWAPDNINGLILLYNGNIEPGCLVKVDEHNLLAIVLQTTLTQTVLKDLVCRNTIIMPNSKLRNCKVEILTKATPNGLIQCAEFNIEYGIESVRVEEFLVATWEASCQLSKAINVEQKPKVRLYKNADHAVVWRLFYYVGNVYRLLDARYAINRSAYDLSQQMNISLKTPVSYQLIPEKTTSN